MFPPQITPFEPVSGGTSESFGEVGSLKALEAVWVAESDGQCDGSAWQAGCSNAPKKALSQQRGPGLT